MVELANEFSGFFRCGNLEPRLECCTSLSQTFELVSQRVLIRFGCWILTLS